MTDVIISNSYHGKSTRVYHTTECVTVKLMQGKDEISQATAEKRGLRECDWCKNGSPQNNNPDFSYFMAAKRAGESD